MGGDILKTFRRSYWGPANRGQIQVPKTGVCGSFTAETFPGLRGSAIRVPVWTSNTKILSKNLKSDFQILATLKDRAESNMDLRIHIHTDIGQVWLAQILPCKTEVALQGTLSSLLRIRWCRCGGHGHQPPVPCWEQTRCMEHTGSPFIWLQNCRRFLPAWVPSQLFWSLTAFYIMSLILYSYVFLHCIKQSARSFPRCR